MAKSLVQLNSEIASLFPDNTSGLITPASERQMLTDVVASAIGVPPVINVAISTPSVLPDGTDQAANLNALLASLETAGTGGTLVFGPGTYRFNSPIIFPNNGAGTAVTQATFVLQGSGGYKSGQGVPGIGGTLFDIRTADVNGHIQTYGLGSLSLRDIQFTDGGASSGNPFLYTTNTTVYARNCAFIGSPEITGLNNDQDAIVLGGTSNTLGPGTNAPFQGYGTIIEGCFFNRVRRLLYCRVFCNGIVFQNNTSWVACGNPLKGALTAAVAGGGVGYAIGDKITLAGGTSSPPCVLTVLTVAGGVITGVTIRQNGNYTVTPANPVAQASTTGGGSGATFNLTYSSGPAIEIDGSGAGGVPGNFAVGNNFLNNTIEINNYAYFASLLFAQSTNFIGNNLYDGTATTKGGINAGGDNGSTNVWIGLITGASYLTGVGAPAIAALSSDNTNPAQFPATISGNLNLTGAVLATGIGQFGTQIQFIQSGGGLGKLAVDGVDLILSNTGSASMFFDNSGAGGKFIWRTTGFATVLDYGNANAGKWTFAAPIVVKSYTVGTLPVGVLGAQVQVSDGDAGLAWGATAINSGAGATKYLVWYNGANWTVVGK